MTLAQGNGYGTSLTDVTVGDNDLSRTHSGTFPAAAGDDLATGLGTPMAGGWSCPEITSMSSTQTAAGDSVTITGFSLADATIDFGNVPATITAQSATSVTVTVPAGAGTVAVHGTNAIGTGTHTVNFSYPGVVTTTTASTTTTTIKPTIKPPPPKPAVNTVNTHAYRLVAADGGIFSFGGAPFFGSTGAVHLNQPIVGMTSDTATGGYWFVARDGGIFAFHAPFFGSTGGAALASPIVGMAATPDGKGYWLVAGNGRVFAFGDAPDDGSVAANGVPADRRHRVRTATAGATGSSDPTAACSRSARRASSVRRPGHRSRVRSSASRSTPRPAATGWSRPTAASSGSTRRSSARPAPSGSTSPSSASRRPGTVEGYWMVARDGGIFGFGNAGFSGSMGAVRFNQPVVGMAAPR